MKFTKDQGSEVTIRQIENNRIKIGNNFIDYSCIVTSDEILGEWGNKNVDVTTYNDLEFILKKKPDILIFGTGEKAVLPNRNLVFDLAKKNIGLEVMTTAAACRTFNILISEDRSPIAILIL
jgi:uncharacterized protein|tara:strand:- start:988 stop:1353 length:366 start_codon:yes stop_codon:yes gene_type:complete